MSTPIAENLECVRENIAAAARRAGRNPDEITLVAVSKTHGPEAIEAAIEAGQLDFGENYVQEADEKIKTIGPDRARFHFIGHLQTNKAKLVAPHYQMVQTVDRAKLARKLGTLAVENGRVLPVLIEVSIAGEESKSGIAPEKVPELIDVIQATEGLALKGLMTMPPFLPAEQARPYFVKLRNLRDKLAPNLPAGMSLDVLSMGMSGDYEVAIEEGATIVRVGTAIFGSR
jgi:PLP dependent protein